MLNTNVKMNKKQTEMRLLFVEDEISTELIHVTTRQLALDFRPKLGQTIGGSQVRCDMQGLESKSLEKAQKIQMNLEILLRNCNEIENYKIRKKYYKNV